jgi:hypothetical protein
LATEKEINEASLQFVRKVSGYRKPSKKNESSFNEAVDQISKEVGRLLANLQSPH